MGGGGGTNPAAGNTQAFGQAIGTVGTGLTDWFGQLKGEDLTAMNQLNPDITQMLGQAFDPQQALYNRTLQQVTDQTRSGEVARGVGDTPYGAAVEGNALSNFNIDWQNNELSRMESGLGSAANTYGQIIQGGATAAQPAEAALQAYTGAYNTSSQAQTAQNAQQQQAQQFGMSQLSGLGGSLGSMMGKGG
jgi:hypothetical protein